MPRPPHHLALFSLFPYKENERAARAVAHPNNNHLVSTLSDGTEALDVVLQISSKSPTTLATLIGRCSEADIYIEGSNVETGVVMLYDKSFAQSTQVFGENAMPFEHGRFRKVLVQDDLNTIIGMCGERRDLFQFGLQWHRNSSSTAKTIKKYDAITCGRMEHPRLPRTVNEAPTNVPSRRETRPHMPGQCHPKMRYLLVEGGKLGSGNFATVYKVIDVDSGKIMAVKILKRPAIVSEQEQWRKSLHYVKREVETLSAISHPHIVDYIAAQGWDEPQLEIFMGLKEGTLNSLIENGANPVAVADQIYPQMLQALDCIAGKGIVHRDVKPENILYISQPGNQYQFQLGDFGLCNRTIDAVTYAGSPIYMAPEILQARHQTHKVDVWSLFVTMLWTLDAEGFRRKSTQFRNHQEVQDAVLSAASEMNSLSNIREMAIIDPEERASAAQMLVKHFGGMGLSTPLNQVPALTSTLPHETTAAGAPPSLTTQTAQTNPRGLQRNANTFAVTAQYRVEKSS